MKFLDHCMLVKELYYSLMQLKVLQAQTMANFYLAFEQDLTIVPVINKIDIAQC